MINAFVPVAVAGIDGKIKKYREENDTVYDYGCDAVKVVTYHNKGAFCNAFDRWPFWVMVLSACLTVIILAVFLVTLGKKGNNALKAGLGLLLGGAFSNTYDRMKKGYVVDYLIFPKAPGRVKNLIFNISDFAIILGALISVFAGEK